MQFRMFIILAILVGLPLSLFASSDLEVRKTQLEDIFIWKISDELKLTAKQEKEFTEISKALNKKKYDLNRQIQETVQSLGTTNAEVGLKKYRKLMADYNQLSLNEFDSIKKLLGAAKFTEYLRVKNELTTKVKSILVGDKVNEKKEPVTNLPPPKVIVEK